MTTESTIEKKNNIVQRRWKMVGFILLGLVIFAISFRLVLRSDWARNYVKSTIESSVNESLNARFTIESLEGDLYKNITLHRINIDDLSGSSVIEIDSVYARYQIWSLIKWKLDINEISLFAPKVNLRQEADSTWNIANLVPEADESTSDRNRFLIHILDLSIQK